MLAMTVTAGLGVAAQVQTEVPPWFPARSRDASSA